MRTGEGPSETWAKFACKLAEATGLDPEHQLRAFLQSHPYAMGPLMHLARRLMERGDANGAAPLLSELDRLGSAEAAFFRGIFALQRCDLWAALEHMHRARDLNPMHVETGSHISEIHRILLEDMPPPLEVTGRDVLVGPHVGALGQASCPHSVIVVTYNSASTIGECAEHVLSTIGPGDELIVIDNASTDGTRHLLAAIAEGDARVRLLPNVMNFGYSKAVNLGLLASKGEILVTLNPDAYVNPGWVESMSERLTEGVAAVGPMSDNIGGDQFVGHLLGSRHPSLEELPGILASEFSGQVQETKFLVGICVMARRETLNAHGLLDEGTELGADDLEFSFRMRMLGLRLLVANDVFVQHEQGVSFASLPSAERTRRQGLSDGSLYRKLEAYFGADFELDSMELFGTPIFDDALFRMRLLLRGVPGVE